MTRPSKKARERFMALEAAKSLGKAWTFSDEREHPDFIVTDGVEQFGLEVSEIFIGPRGNAGSTMKQQESYTQQTMNKLRRQYEDVAKSRCMSGSLAS
jgi:hypothetical protein